MPVDFETIVGADLSVLHDASMAWKKMGDRFGELHDDYRDHVKAAVEADEQRSWRGQAAGMFRNQAQLTQREYAGARNEARAVSGLLEDAYTTLTSLRQRVFDVKAEAESAGMDVDAYGRCSLNLGTLPEDEREAYQHHHLARQELEASWNQKITDAVEAVRQADQNANEALMAPPVSMQEVYGFDTSLTGDIGEVNSRQVDDLYEKIKNGETLTDREYEDLDFLMEANEGDPEFSRTLLTSLGGPDGAIRIHNELAERAYTDDTGNRKRHLDLTGHLANAVSTATTVDGEDTATDKRFYEQWRADLREAGVQEYRLDFTDHGPEDVQDVRGYQSLVSLLQQGGGYDDRFLHDLADDIRAVEDRGQGGDPDIWDLRGTFAGERQRDGTFDDSRNGWFANDPLDGVLGVMSKDPAASTAYFDPATEQGEDRFQYLAHDRDWHVVDTHAPAKNAEQPGDDTADADSRTGFGAALEAAMTGHAPGTETPDDFARHRPEESRLLEHVITEYADASAVDKGAIPENMRQNFANTLAHYPEDVHDILGKLGHVPSEMNGVDVDRTTMHHFIRGVAEDGAAFRTIHDSQMEVIAGDIHTLDADDLRNGSDKAVDVAQRSGQAMGALDTIRADVLGADRDEEIDRNNWNKTYQYHAAGALVTGTPIFGDAIQRLIDIGAGENAEALNKEVADKTTEELIEHYTKNGLPRLEKMFNLRGKQVGMSDPELGEGDFQRVVLDEVLSRYSAGHTDSGGSTGDWE
ncbi:hypothetical protein GCM10023347_03400 [Streptomyces chumphonensis]|uniref:DUF6571 domain-containing protein n=1 Tax=Streptomyces chumphonensis TaxID=1214925 RepID=A0A927F296_9ACTN|nr:DUF6571 family protein [Streptomyces chumphonensis]MBD3934224.1 hypothetical protein [Streptomyces chumphonensis]